jgi:hypothetical protein
VYVSWPAEILRLVDSWSIVQEAGGQKVQLLQKHDFVWLSKAMDVCPHPVYVNLGLHLSKHIARSEKTASLPAEFTFGTGKLKTSLVEGLEGEKWSLRAKNAVAQVLLEMENAVLYSHLGACTKVRSCKLAPSFLVAQLSASVDANLLVQLYTSG